MQKIYFSALLVALCFFTNAQQTLDTVTVTASRAQSTWLNATKSIEVLTQKDIADIPANTTNETLESVSSVDVRQRGPLDIQSDISVRGGSFDQTLVLLNGIRMTDPQTGHHNMNLPISYDLISQIEVLEGGGSRIYGPNAFAGAVNILTPMKGKDALYAKIIGGAYGLRLANIGASFNTNKWYSLVSLNGMASDGYIRNTDFKSTNIYGQTVGKLNIGTLLLSAGYNKKGFGAQDFYTSTYPEQYESTQTIFASAKLTGGKNWKYAITSYWRQHNDVFELFREDDNYYIYNNGYFIKGDLDTAQYAPGAYYKGHNYNRTRVFGADAQLKRTWEKWGTTTFGFDYRNEQLASGNLGKPIDEPINVPNHRGQYSKADARDNYSLYAEQYFTVKKFLFTLGALANYNSSFGADVMPGIDIGYRLKPSVLIFGSIDRSFRFPTYTDLYYNLGGAKGSENLETEYSTNLEAGVRYQKSIFKASFAVFSRNGTNMIDWLETPNGIFAENLTNVVISGVSASTALNLASQTKGWIKEITLGYTFLTSDQTEDELQSLYVLDFLQHKLNIGLTHKVFLEALTMNWRIAYQQRNGTYVEYATKNTVAYQPFWLVDARLTYTLKSTKLFVQANNLFDVNYVDRGNVLQPGIWVSAGFSLRLERK